MSIDADLKAGIIDTCGCRARRQRTGKGSQLAVSFDGAMKFYQGDAVPASVLLSL